MGSRNFCFWLFKRIMRDKIMNDENYMSEYEKQVVINREIDKILADLPEYRKEQPYDKYDLGPIKEEEQGKFVHGQKWPIEPTEPTKLKPASKPRKSGQIKPKETKKLRSMLFEVTILECSDYGLTCTKLLSAEGGHVIMKIPDSPFSLKIPVANLRRFLYASISSGNPGYMTIEKGSMKFKVAIEINPQVLLDNDEATLI